MNYLSLLCANIQIRRIVKTVPLQLHQCYQLHVFAHELISIHRFFHQNLSQDRLAMFVALLYLLQLHYDISTVKKNIKNVSFEWIPV